MPVIQPVEGGFTFTTTVQDILDQVQSDLIYEMGSGHPKLIDYCNRIQQMLMRTSRWRFTLSEPLYFITTAEQPNYWVGPSNLVPPGNVNTGLNLTDFGIVAKDTVFDRSNNRQLKYVSKLPSGGILTFRDSMSRPGIPSVFHQDVWEGASNSNTIQLWPSPNNQNDYQPRPDAPILTTTAGGSLADRVYYVKLTLVDSMGGESSPSDMDQEIFVPAGSLLQVRMPWPKLTQNANGVLYNQYNVYVSETAGAEVLQTSSPLNCTRQYGVDWTEPTSGLVTGTATPPTNSGIAPLNGYVIEFRYFKTRLLIQEVGDVIMLPDQFKDVFVAGVNWLAYQYLKKPQEALQWAALYEAGVRGMIRDKNLFPKGGGFIMPDPASQWNPQSIDPSVLEILNY